MRTPEQQKLINDHTEAWIAFRDEKNVEFEFLGRSGNWKPTGTVFFNNANKPAGIWHRIKSKPVMRPFKPGTKEWKGLLGKG